MSFLDFSSNFMYEKSLKVKDYKVAIKLAKEMHQYGVASNFALLQPVPGTTIFDYCMKNGQISKDYNPDKFQWMKANLKNTAIPPDELEKIRDKAWHDCNSDEFVKVRKSWAKT
mgnify:CR=1 FL=1